MTTTAQYITDPDDFCRACKGTGSENHESPTGAYVISDCYLCGGSGCRSVKMTHQPSEVAT